MKELHVGGGPMRAAGHALAGMERDSARLTMHWRGLRRTLLRTVVLLAGVVAGGACAPPPSLERVSTASHRVALAPAARPTGPVPDFAPMAVIATHESLEGLVPAFASSLTELLGDAHRVTRHHWLDQEDPRPDYEDDSAVWMRDYQPLFVRSADGHLVARRYLSQNPNRSAYAGPLWPSAAATPPVLTLPILHENGNLVTTGRLTFVTEQIFEENSEPADARHLLHAGYRPRGRAELLFVLARALELAPGDIVPLPRMPYEATGHIDVYLLPLDERTVVVPSLDDEAVETSTDETTRAIASVVRVFLDEQADYLSHLGLAVVRVPMLAPAFTEPDSTGAGEGSDPDDEPDLLFFTPANSLLANVGGRRLAFVPSFDEVSDNPRVRALSARYVAAWQRTLRDHGWETHTVDASGLVRMLGLFRCVSASVPD